MRWRYGHPKRCRQTGQSSILWSFPFRNRVKNDGFSIARIDGGEICTLSYNIWFVFFSATICLNVWDDDPNSGKVWWLKTTSQILYMNLYIYIIYIYIYTHDRDREYKQIKHGHVLEKHRIQTMDSIGMLPGWLGHPLE